MKNFKRNLFCIVALVAALFVCSVNGHEPDDRLLDAAQRPGVTTYCAGGYLFVVAYTREGEVVIKQVYRDGGGPLAKPQPKKCDK